MSGLIGGKLGYRLLKRFGRSVAAGHDPCAGVCEGTNKLEASFGASIWDFLAGKTVIDFGCGTGNESIALAKRGVKRVIGYDIRPDVLQSARAASARAGVDERCTFVEHVCEPADVVISLDGFEHYDDPASVLNCMRELVRDDGCVLVSFGPPWLHPYGGHLFSVFPWAHLIFTEAALIRWRSDFKTDGATRFREVAGGLNQMTIQEFRNVVARSDFDIRSFETVPIRAARHLWNPLLREYLTSVVKCTLTPRKRVVSVAA